VIYFKAFDGLVGKNPGFHTMVGTSNSWIHFIWGGPECSVHNFGISDDQSLFVGLMRFDQMLHCFHVFLLMCFEFMDFGGIICALRMPHSPISLLS